MNYPTADTGHIYPEMSKYIDSNGFTFDHKKEITTGEFEEALTEKMHLVAHCVFNEKESFPNSDRAFINGEDFEGKLVDYLKDSPYWEDEGAEWVYCITLSKLVCLFQVLKKDLLHIRVELERL